jgi:hypothetical protein
MPRDFSSMITLARDPASGVQIIICADASYSADPFLIILPVSIRVPSLWTRTDELPRIIGEYARDATTGACTGSGRAPRSRSFASPAAAGARRPSSRSRPALHAIRCLSRQ